LRIFAVIFIVIFSMFFDNPGNDDDEYEKALETLRHIMAVLEDMASEED